MVPMFLMTSARVMPMPVSEIDRVLFVAVGLDADVRLAARRQVGAGQPLEAELVDRVGRVRDQLAQEDVLVGVERMDHEVEQLLDLGLELVTLGGLAHGGGSVL